MENTRTHTEGICYDCGEEGDRLDSSGKIHDFVDIFVDANSCSHCCRRPCLFLTLLAGGGTFSTGGGERCGEEESNNEVMDIT